MGFNSGFKGLIFIISFNPSEDFHFYSCISVYLRTLRLCAGGSDSYTLLWLLNF